MRILSALIAAIMLLANTVVWAEGDTVLTACDDTAIYENEPDSSKMDAKELRIHYMGKSKHNKEAWIRFDASKLVIPKGMRVKSAVLSLYFTKISNSNSDIVTPATATVWSLTDNDYDESVTWNSTGRPTREYKLAQGLLKSKSEWKSPFWLDFDVTSHTRNSHGGLLAFSVYIEGVQGSGAYIASGEYSDGKYAPKLTVTFEEDPNSTMTILPTADTRVDYNDTQTAYGNDELLYDNALFDFSLSSAGDDDAKITDKNGYFGVDITGYVSEHFLSDKRCVFYLEGTDFMAYSKESAENKPYIKIVFDTNKIHSATLYLYGVGSDMALYTISGFDEKTVTADNMPEIGKRITLGGTGAEFETTVEGYSHETLNTTYYMKLDPGNAYPKYDEVFDKTKVPSASEIEGMLEGLVHPYLLCDYDGFERIKELKETDEYIKKWYATVEESGERFLSSSPSAYVIRGNALSSNVDDGAMTLAFLYRTTSDSAKRTEYAEKCLEYLREAVEYPDFNPVKMLNVGEMSRGVALGYDWLYDYEGFSDSAKQAVCETLTKKALDVIIETKYSNHNNWNHVVNGGTLVAALAVGGVEKEKAAKVIYHAVTTLPVALKLYYPDGVFIEASGYYEYASSYLASALATLESTLGTDFGLGEIEGMSENGYYPIYTKGYTEKQAISYGDGEMAPVSSPLMMYQAKRYNNTDFGMYQREADNNDLFSIIWYNPESYINAPKLSTLPEDYFADGVSQTISLRDGWADKDAFFAGMKGGYNQMSHGDLDIGNFYLGAYGESFTKELLGVDYHSQDDSEAPYFRLSRYKYYAKSPQGHNTIVINQPKYYPDMSFGQNLRAKAEYVKTHSGEDESFAVLDMTKAYSIEVNSAYRGIKLDKAHDRVIISDKISAKGESDVWWFMHTDAKIETNGKKAKLTIGENSIYAEIISNCDAEFYVMDAVPLLHTPTVAAFDTVTYIGEKKLAVRLKDVTEEELQISFSKKENDAPEFLSLSFWGDAHYGTANILPDNNIRLIPTDDAYADDRNGGVVNNNGNSLKVMYANYGFNYVTFLRFKNNADNASEVEKATLTLHAIRNDTIGDIEQKEETVVLYPAGKTWNEETLTEKNAPEVDTDTHIASATVPYIEGTKTIDTYITFDITEYYKSLTDKTDISLAIKLTSRKNGCVYFDDKETGYAPVLDITYKSNNKKTVILPFEEPDARVYLCNKKDGELEGVKIFDFTNGEAEVELFEDGNVIYVWDGRQKPVWFVVKD